MLTKNFSKSSIPEKLLLLSILPQQLQKAPIPQHISLEHAPRFLPHTEEPFETIIRHPLGGTLLQACRKIKARADTNAYRNIQHVLILADKHFLLRAAKSNNQNIRFCSLDLFQNLFDFLRIRFKIKIW